MTPLTNVNALDEDAFVALLGGIFEHSPWVARRAYGRRPFDSRETLHVAMVDVVEHATRSEQLALLSAHPELGGNEARAGTLTAASAGEQSSAGLHALSPALSARIGGLNKAYREKFGFPFVIAVRDYDRDGLLAELERRLRHDPATELTNGLEQVYRIAAIRLASTLSHAD